MVLLKLDQKILGQKTILSHILCEHAHIDLIDKQGSKLKVDDLKD